MNIKGIGTDIIEVKRIEAAFKRHDQRFVDRLFTLKEQEYCFKHQDAARHLAGRFAAKEAIVKALGTGFRHGINWLDIEILNDENGKPTIILSSKLNEMFSFPQLMLSISHCREYATAFVIYTKDKR